MRIKHSSVALQLVRTVFIFPSVTCLDPGGKIASMIMDLMPGPREFANQCSKLLDWTTAELFKQD